MNEIDSVNFRETYKEENALITPNPAFIEELISGLQKSHQNHKRRKRRRLVMITTSAAAAVCFIAVGWYIITDSVNGGIGFMKSDMELDAPRVGSPEEQDFAYGAEENNRVIAGDRYNNADEAEEEEVDYEFDEAGLELYDSEQHAPAAGNNADENWGGVLERTSEEELMSEIKKEFSFEHSGVPLAEAMYNLILEILKVVSESYD
ncbi:MAG: hypothetical protein FWG33_03145 [Oscillospiraceae bacterium]|nr:hypothetical protein [Oscillospiraceae bacterium]